MKELVIDKLGDNQRLDKYLSKYLSAASKSFIYKMLRKKNITLNNKKADGSEKLVMGDSVKTFFAPLHWAAVPALSVLAAAATPYRPQQTLSDTDAGCRRQWAL